MCSTCGCGKGEVKIEGHEHEHQHADGTVHSHPHSHEGEHGPGHSHDHDHAHGHHHGEGAMHYQPHEGGEHSHLHFGHGPAGAHAPGLSQARMVAIEQDILAKNNAFAAENRRYFAEHGIFAVNLVSSPGSGKTTLLTRSIERLKGRTPVAVIEGDQQTVRDAERIRATGAPAVQINTGKGCHLDAHMVGQALPRLAPADDSLLMIENVGNLVCPAAFDLGEAHKVAILGVTEGEDKPLKYPDMFAAADLMLLNKVDLLPYLQFNAPLCIEYARRVNPNIRVILTSAVTGEGLDEWLAWLAEGLAQARKQKSESIEALKRRVAELEAKLSALQQ
ncbi:MAG: hydrogenase nickel incorporation protein HypB [Betaproteobacteria bacterium]|nr:hydrogenase nickel incorporation protein HypB [Betaproteobacteria bacterium]